MNYATIKKNDVANGTGVRVSLFVSGCRHGCRDCFNREAWDFSFGKEFTDDIASELLSACDKGYIEGLSLLGGEPFEPENQAPILQLLRRFCERFPEKNVWCYTGFTLGELYGGSRASTDAAREMLSYIDVLVDGRYEADKRDLMLRFRGSSNQRIIDMKKTTDISCPVIWDDSTDIPNFEGE